MACAPDFAVYCEVNMNISDFQKTAGMPSGSIEAAFCGAHSAIAAAFDAHNKQKPGAAERIALAVWRALQIGNMAGANLERELINKASRNRRRHYEWVDGKLIRTEDAPDEHNSCEGITTFRAMQTEVYQNKVNHGFNITDLKLEFCLAYGELAEAYDAYAAGGEGLAEELADVIIYLLGIAEIMGADIEAQLKNY